MKVSLKLPQVPHLEVGLDFLSCVLHYFPQVPIFGPQLTTALIPFLRSPMLATFLTYLLAPLVLSAIASQPGQSTCPWILVSRSASAGAQPKTLLRHVLFKGRSPLSSENEATKWDFSLAKRSSAQWKIFILVYFLGNSLQLYILLNKV